MELKFIFDPTGMLVTQRQYIRGLLSDCRPVHTPMIDKLKLEPDMSAPLSDTTTYQRMVGKLIFLTYTKHDISFVVGLVSGFMYRPQELHLLVVKHIYTYLRGTSELALLYQRGEGNILCGFTDAAWAGDVHNWNSTTGFVFLLGSTPITWNSKKQPMLRCLQQWQSIWGSHKAPKEAMWLRRLFGELKLQNLQVPTIIFGDKLGAQSGLLWQNKVCRGTTSFHKRKNSVKRHCS